MLLDEYGFWDYTPPFNGGMEKYGRNDYMSLLDDMAGAGMNSLVVVIKWVTTGYRSRLPFLDQLPGNPMIESDNELLRMVIDEATKRGIRVWLGAVVSIYVADRFGGEPYEIHESFPGGYPCVPFGLYDADHPGFTERAIQVCEEIVELFPGAHGLMVELEGSGREAPHRVPLYEVWAKNHGRTPFAELAHPLNARQIDAPDWRDYTTSRRIDVLKGIENAVRGKGFAGRLSTLFEGSSTQHAVTMEVNLQMMKSELPDWKSVTYEHDKWNHRYASMDMNVATPKEFGHTVYYLPRGVMTWCDVWPMPIPIEENWRQDVEDIKRFQPDGVWWFGTGTKNEGAGTALGRLRDLGYESGEAARRALLKATKELCGL